MRMEQYLMLCSVCIVLLDGCRRIEPERAAEMPAETPAPRPERTIRVRLLERLEPRKLVVRGPMRVSSRKVLELNTGKAVLTLDRGMVAVDGVLEASTIFVDAVEGHLNLDPGRSYERRVAGRLEVYAGTRSLVVVAEMPLEEYIAGVVAAELVDGELEALEAQAVIARTFVLNQRPRHDGYEVCDLTHCQVFKGIPRGRFLEAANATKDVILSADGCTPAPVYYASTCGGHTAAFNTIWPSRDSPRYLVGVPDLAPDGKPWCRRSPHMNWQFSIDEAVLAGMLEEAYGKELESPLKIGLVRGAGGWVARVRVAGIDDYVTGEEFHLLLAREFGWSQFKSAHFQVVRDEAEGGRSRLVFKGRGLGHGVGLCQYGAMAMAEAGLTFEEMLSHYYPKLERISWHPECMSSE